MQRSNARRGPRRCCTHRMGAAAAVKPSVQKTYSPLVSLRSVTVALAALSASARSDRRHGRSDRPGTSRWSGPAAMPRTVTSLKPG